MDPGDEPIRPEFRVAIYENLIQQIQTTEKLKHVYRSGDKDAASVPDLITLRTTAQSFQKSSQKKREVTTVAGASLIIT
jgi:ketosteroid isomerase-like protein